MAMGTVISDDEKRNNQNKGCGCEVNFFNVSPEECIAEALSLTSPRDVCRLSLVASTVHQVAESDAVWEKFLPPDWSEIVARSSSPSISSAFASKKQLYLHLCDHPLIIDGATKTFSLEKSNGKKCYMLAARDLLIVWADTPRYWRWISHPDSRFPEVAELMNVCWLDIQGKINTCMLSPDTTYAGYLVFKWTSGAYGFEYQPAEVSVGISGGESQTRTVFLDPDGGQRHRYQIAPRRIGINNPGTMNMMMQPAPVPTEGDGQQYPKKRADGWMEIELGEYVNVGQQDRELEMTLLEVKGGNWKSGLIVQGIEIRPKDTN